MNDIFSKNGRLDDLLQRVGRKLQISETQRELAEERYLAVGKWLSKDGLLFDEEDISIYSQGSLRIGTTVKPLKRQEYDLDLVCEINEPWQGKDPLKLLDLIEDRLREHKVYKKMIERKNRCIRLVYANEFHMDILPAHPADSQPNTHLKVPDRKAEGWKDSNPKGYAEWFKERAKYTPIMLEKRAEIEPLPQEEEIEIKPPLKRAVQLIKRYRDIYFRDEPDSAPISIVLTTLAGQVYDGQASVNEALTHILEKIMVLIQSTEYYLKVYNPANRKEELSERWKDQPNLYKSFSDFIHIFHEKWIEVNEHKNIHEIIKSLKDMFGENIIEETVTEQAEYLGKMRELQNVGVTQAGTLVAVAQEAIVPVRRNTFYGE